MNTLNTKQKKVLENNIVLYTNKDGKVELRADVRRDTLWATQEQIAQLFGSERSVVTKHISNIFKDSEVEQKSNVQKMHIANSDKPVQLYSLDIILSVGYRTNSHKAIAFRKWATTILRTYLVSGHALNTHVLTTSPDKFIGLDEAVALLKSSKHPGKLKGNLILKIKKEVV